VRVHQFGAGETLVRQNDAAESFFIMRRGAVEVVAETSDGTQAHIADLKPPAIFGEIALMTGEPRNSTVRARSDVEVLEMDREAFTRLFRNHPELAGKMGDIIATRISERHDILRAVPDNGGNHARRNWLLSKMRAVFDF
ncbi:MAG: cyclic nucleotide-binding domain-containing protein, partial [Candidatus Binataceae bacterium]